MHTQSQYTRFRTIRDYHANVAYLFDGIENHILDMGDDDYIVQSVRDVTAAYRRMVAAHGGPIVWSELRQSGQV